MKILRKFKTCGWPYFLRWLIAEALYTNVLGLCLFSQEHPEILPFIAAKLSKEDIEMVEMMDSETAVIYSTHQFRIPCLA